MLTDRSAITATHHATTPSPVRAMHSLRPSHVDAAQLAVSILGPEWAVDHHDTYDGHLILQLHPGNDDDCSFILHGAKDGVRLGLFSADSDYACLGTFDSISAALQFAAQLASGEIPFAAVAPAA